MELIDELKDFLYMLKNDLSITENVDIYNKGFKSIRSHNQIMQTYIDDLSELINEYDKKGK